MSARRKATLPPYPWEQPRNEPRAEWPKRTSEAARHIVEPAPAHVRKLITNAFAGDMDETDLKYMARAILQISDEFFALRARCDELEREVTELRGRDK